MGCHYCGYHNDNHSPDCPKDSPELMRNWQEGWNAGHRGETPPDEGGDPRYGMGFLRGVVALEAAQNGSGWVRYP